MQQSLCFILANTIFRTGLLVVVLILSLGKILKEKPTSIQYISLTGPVIHSFRKHFCVADALSMQSLQRD